MSDHLRIAVLGSPTSWYTADLRRAAESGGHDVVPVTFSELRADILDGGESFSFGQVGGNEQGADRPGVDAVIVRSMPPGSLEQIVFRMNALARLEASGVLVMNSPRSLEIAIDKYLALAKLSEAGFVVPSTICCQTVDQAMDAFDNLGGDTVIKPLFGGEGRGMVRITSRPELWRIAKMMTGNGSVCYLQKFIPHYGFDQRLLVVGEEVFGMIRRNEKDWRTNVSRGATTEGLDVTEELADSARRAAQAVGAPFCALDLLPGKDGKVYALEVNGVPGWRALARTLNVDIANKVIEYVAFHSNRKPAASRILSPDKHPAVSAPDRMA